MPAQLTVIAPKRAAEQVMIVDQSTYLIGRAANNDIVIAEPSVSRQHARLRYEERLWVMNDLNSVNGLRSNGIQQQCCFLEHGAVVLVGNVPVLFKNIEVQHLQQQLQYDKWRKSQVMKLQQQSSKAPQSDITEFLTQALTLCQMERAAVLLGNDLASLKLYSSCGVSKTAREDSNFFGSLGALQMAMGGEALITNDISQHQALSQRASVKLKQLSALACFPLICQGQLLGLFYIDSQQPTKFLSTVDAELLQTLVDNISLNLFSQQIDQQLQYIAVNSRQFN
ncbi:MAG: hypothetical protein CML20_07305 [Rheinheimera sp.]|uniref:FHA domain-containing protein n=1 Tax=Arsukibacterium sp. UBA3155 TaxID=1946058 RepID=UPI000C8DDFE4|nr:FHA domain-containing protein [Arsukibacterium sp. UBA3155]MAD74580.1 hypothetical protein [Rheinheimera sp.]|tara:strand:- start:1302 stop:2150 length:849 start_codon:yes stop_codon:yes gene_type:complete